MALVVAGLVFIGAGTLIAGASGRERRLAHWMVWPAAVVLIASFAGPSLQAENAIWAQLPVRIVVAAVFPNVAWLACLALLLMRRDRRRRDGADDAAT